MILALFLCPFAWKFSLINKIESLQCGRYSLPMSGADFRPLVMGILNVTPDSFSDGGLHGSLDLAITHAENMIAEGVDIIDIGGESTRPGAPPVSLEEELRRIMPVIYALRDCGKPLSIDTRRPAVMRAAVDAGADMINDIEGFRAEGALAAISDTDCALCIMHMQGEPKTMQLNPHYEDVVVEVSAFLHERVRAAREAGIARNRLCIDPGFGFGKTTGHNLQLLTHIAQLQAGLQLPLLAGLSRKSMLGMITGRPVEQRMVASVSAALMATLHGARILRVHDVAETIDALKIWQAVEQQAI